MAEKLSDSIRRKVRGLQKALEGTKEAPAPKEKGSGASPSAVEPAGPAGSAATPSAKPAKAKPQPWYRHRQRW
jgi:hypothetical protein